MNSLSDALLIETHKKAKLLQLEERFIELLQLEMYRRNLQGQLLVKINS